MRDKSKSKTFDILDLFMIHKLGVEESFRHRGTGIETRVSRMGLGSFVDINIFVLKYNFI